MNILENLKSMEEISTFNTPESVKNISTNQFRMQNMWSTTSSTSVHCDLTDNRNKSLMPNGPDLTLEDCSRELRSDSLKFRSYVSLKSDDIR